MKIGLIAPPWVPVPPPAYGGIEVVVDGLARGLKAAGHEILLAAAGNSTCPVPQVPGSPIAGDFAPAGGTAIAEVGHILRAYEAMAEAEVDLIHDHTVIGPITRGPGEARAFSTL